MVGPIKYFTVKIKTKNTRILDYYNVNSSTGIFDVILVQNSLPVNTLLSVSAAAGKAHYAPDLTGFGQMRRLVLSLLIRVRLSSMFVYVCFTSK